MKHPYDIVKDFERAIAEYTGAPLAVAVSSCTEALLLACAYHKHKSIFTKTEDGEQVVEDTITIPKHTYVGVPMSILHAGWKVKFDDRQWEGQYRLDPLPVWDSAKWLTSDMYAPGQMICLSLHWAKHLSVGWGGVILLDDPEADTWLRKARFDGRSEGVHPGDDTFDQLGWHCIMSPAQAAEALTRLSFLPKHNSPIPNDGYPDLSKHKIFGG